MKFSNEDLIQKLNKFRKESTEREWLEFKEAEDDFSFEKLGKYFSALSNEAQLKSAEYGWLILGIQDKTRKITGTSFKQRASFEDLKHDLAQHITGNITFIEIYELNLPEGRILMFQIPPAPKGIPIAWKGHFYGRDGESLVPLNIQELEAIRGVANDWSEQTCEEASIDDLDNQAIDFARVEFTKKNPHLADEIKKWDDKTFLNKAKLTVNGKITKTAILLLGRSESTHFLSPQLARITWVVKDHKSQELDYHHIEPPFILSSRILLEKIRNLKYRYMPDATLFPEELTKYDPWVLREALHNCIAHQDYALKGRIVVVENPDEVIFVNMGRFIPGTIENVIKNDAPSRQYRNPFLVGAMANVNMIDIIGSGIRRMFIKQRDRFFPLPTYEISVDEVKVCIIGKIINPVFTQLLRERTDLDLDSVVLLDYVQKSKRISKQAHLYLKKNGLVEGRYPNLLLSSEVHAVTGDRDGYIKNRGLDKSYYEQLVIHYLEKFKQANRKEIDQLLLDKLPDILTTIQKHNKIRNLLHDLSKKQSKIINKGSDKAPLWVLHISNKLDVK